jgi:hypothetical protein
MDRSSYLLRLIPADPPIEFATRHYYKNSYAVNREFYLHEVRRTDESLERVRKLAARLAVPGRWEWRRPHSDDQIANALPHLAKAIKALAPGAREHCLGPKPLKPSMRIQVQILSLDTLIRPSAASDLLADAPVFVPLKDPVDVDLEARLDQVMDENAKPVAARQGTAQHSAFADSHGHIDIDAENGSETSSTTRRTEPRAAPSESDSQSSSEKDDRPQQLPLPPQREGAEHSEEVVAWPATPDYTPAVSPRTWAPHAVWLPNIPSWPMPTAPEATLSGPTACQPGAAPARWREFSSTLGARVIALLTERDEWQGRYNATRVRNVTLEAERVWALRQHEDGLTQLEAMREILQANSSSCRQLLAAATQTAPSATTADSHTQTSHWRSPLVVGMLTRANALSNASSPSANTSSASSQTQVCATDIDMMESKLDKWAAGLRPYWQHHQSTQAGTGGLRGT